MQRLATFCRRLPVTQNRHISFVLRHSAISPAVYKNFYSRRAHTLPQVNTQDIISSSLKATMSESAESFGNYNLIKRVKLDFTDVVVSKWKSGVTGLTVIHLDYQAPLVNGCFVVPTEIFDDSGCPHTLEHLVFMGSEKYPYKGVLDLLANRAFSNGTNAWTDTDHTAYTMSTAGGQGFLQLLPIYVDHILYPTITDAGFVTEVHHIDGKGHDSGVVYSEMQGRENTPADLMAHRLQRLLYEPGNGYRSETGGLMDALRVLTPEQIRNYHASYYVPHNLVLIVAGKLTGGTSSLLRVVQEQVEPNLIQHNQNKGARPAGWKRPFLETPSAQRKPISATTKSVVEFPEKDESVGELWIRFLGPPPNDFLTMKALEVLGLYLTSSSAAPLNKEYIEIESPLCSYISIYQENRPTCTTLTFYIGSVPTNDLDTFNEKIAASLKRIIENGIDMQRMAMIINRDERQLRSDLESEKGNYFNSIIISDLLYCAEDGSELHPSMNLITYLNILRSWTSSQWTALLSRFLVEQHSVIILGKPSARLAVNLVEGEKARIANQIKKLGPEGLKAVERKLEAAKEAHNKPIPTDILTSFPVPDVKSISWIPIQTVQEAGVGRKANPHVASRNGELQKRIESDGRPLPFFVEYDHVESDFVSVHAYFSLAKLPNHLRPYMYIYLSAFFSLPVVRHNGVRLTHEDVINQLDNDTVWYNVGFGVTDSQFPNTFRVSIKVERAAYETAVAWLWDLIYGSEFDKERIQVVLAKIQQSLPELKRDGDTVLASLLSDLLYSEDSMSKFTGVLALAESIPKLTQRLQESPEGVLADLESIRKHVVDPSGVRFSVAGNILGVNQPRSTWDKYFGRSLPPTPLSPVPLSSQTLSAVGKNCSGQAIVMGLSTIESSFVTLTAKGIQGFDHAEYPVIRLALEILNATEGYLWRHIRGSGLAYGAGVELDVEAGFLQFSLYRSSNPMKAIEEAVSMLRNLVDGSTELPDTTVAAAVSTIVYGVTRNVANANRAASTSFVDQALRGVPQSHQIDLLEKYPTIKKDDILAAIKIYVIPIFNPASSVAVVVTAPGNAQSIGEGLTGIGFDVTQKELRIDPTDMEEDESGTEADSDSDNPASLL